MIAVITAGGSVDDALAHDMGTRFKALAPLRTGRLIDPVLCAVQAIGAREVVVIAAPEVADYCSGRVNRVLTALDDGAANVAQALRLAPVDEPLLLATCDLPFCTSDALTAFLGRCGDAELAMPVADSGAYRAAFPEAPKHSTRIGRVDIANGSVFYFASGAAAERALEIAQSLFRARKSILKMAQFLEPALLLRYAFGQLQIEHIERYALQRFGVRAKAIAQASPTLCFDVDTQADYQYVLANPDVA
jgi:GTP:adenosylcobinamide-phosphate guanylyltransferase